MNHTSYRIATVMLVTLTAPPFTFADSTTLSAGYGTGLVIKSDQTLFSWGSNGSGAYNYNYGLVSGTDTLQDLVSVSLGSNHVLALKGDATVWSWGSSSSGQLGNGTAGSGTTATTPVQVYGLSDVVAVSAGSAFSIALKSDGTVWAWGSNNYGQIGDSTTTDKSVPIQVEGLSNVTAIDAGGSFALALKGDGTVWAWGSDHDGQLGDGYDTHRYSYSSTPIQVTGLSAIKKISAGNAHALAVDASGNLWGWGDNAYSEINATGYNNYNVYTPVQIAVAGVAPYIDVSAGSTHSLALRSDGAVVAWGRNNRGQTGQNDDQETEQPTAVSGIVDIQSISAGSDFSLALTRNGTLYAWGYNDSGQLGQRMIDSNSHATPVAVLGAPLNINDEQTGETAIAASYQNNTLSIPVVETTTDDGVTHRYHVTMVPRVNFGGDISFSISTIEELE
ncbi:RCC1 domain-containing protein [Endothiovibrio diazotrophicus]